MSGKMMTLIAAAVLAAVLAFVVAQNRAPNTQVVDEAPLFAGLNERINDVDRVTITGAGDEIKVSLVRGEDAWTVAERGGYRADPAKVRKLLIDLANARLIERKTSRPENYSALGVEDVADAAAAGIKITLGGLDAVDAVILGNSARNNAAMYARRSSEAASWVADTRLRIDQKPEAWLVKDLIDVNASRVKQVRITHADGEVVEAIRGAENFEVTNLPDGKSLSSPNVADAMAGVLDDLKFEDVVAAADFPAENTPAATVVYQTSDGLEVNATATAASGKFYLSLTTKPLQLDAQAFASNDEPAEGAPSAAEKAVAMFAAMQTQSAQINARVDGWVYTIPLFKYEQLTRRITDLVGEEEPGPK